MHIIIYKRGDFINNKCIFSFIKKEINSLKKICPWFVVGKTALKEDIVCFKVGKNPQKKILIQGAIHAREYICTLLILKQIRFLLNFDINATVYFIPIVNIDGVKIVLKGFDAIKKPTISKFLKSFKVSNKIFKSNINGVDLNTNFDACWGGGKKNIIKPSAFNYIGPFPHSESETLALVNLTKTTTPQLCLSYHCKGEVIYFGFKQKGKSLKFHKKMIEKLNTISKYRLIKTKKSCGGYTDYCILKHNIVACTIEVGQEKFGHPFPISELSQIVSKNLLTPLIATKII